MFALVTGFSAAPAPAQAAQAPAFSAQAGKAYAAPAVYGRATYLIDASNGKTLLSENATERMPIASLTKVMTAYVVLSEAGPSDTVKITADDVQYAEDGDGTTADLRPGDRLPVKELLYGLLLPSGADAAHALARTYGPGVDGFVGKMNATARRLGLRDTLYVNADGLPTSEGDGYSTAQDQARLAAAALRDKAFARVVSTSSHSVDETEEHQAYTWTSTNRLLGEPGVLGVKTGFTNAAGFCLTFAADRDGHRLIGVILGEDVSSRRFDTAESLLDWAAERGPGDGAARGDL
ncbi:D-alanyl-D-alanine carboxypeptidase family protein [Sphaerisporangium perillae]|uniref:D-alanyl-D-alanine carboxypeptidase family protein n=1 Tax=Sphaerisporangium perillae TaxID=2935860 RepID=UPI00200E35CE|nr:serine hydrolase [Sphaerisporangium perillae]